MAVADPAVKAAGKIDVDGVSLEVVTYRTSELCSLSCSLTRSSKAETSTFFSTPCWRSRMRIGSGKPLARSSDPSTGIVGGSIVDPDGRVQHIGYVSGLDGFFATPAHREDTCSAYGALSSIRRHVTAVHGSFMAVKGSVLRTIGGLSGIDQADGLYGIEFCPAGMHGIKAGIFASMAATFKGQLAQPAGANHALVARILKDYPSAGAPDLYYSSATHPRAAVFGSPILE